MKETNILIRDGSVIKISNENLIQKPFDEIISGSIKTNITITKGSVYIEDCRINDLLLFKQTLIDNYSNKFRSISFRKCCIFKIPVEFFNDFPNLESIDLYANSIEYLNFNLPKTLTALDISYNRVKEVSMEILPDSLEYINLSYNFLTEIPPFPTKINVSLDHNNIETSVLHRNLLGVLNNDVNLNIRFNNARPGLQYNQGLVNNTQTVHDKQIQENIRTTIKYLIIDISEKYPYEPNYISDILHFYTVSNLKLNRFSKYFSGSYWSMKYLLNYYNSFEDIIVYSYEPYLSCTMSQLLERIWAFSKEHPSGISIIGNLYIQLKEGVPYCFVGKYTRLINTLTSFVSGLNTDFISINDKIGNKIVYLQRKFITNDQIKVKIREYMISLGVSEEDMKPWIDALD